MSNQILQVDENMLETKLDRLVSRKVEELLNAMPDASGRRDHRGPRDTSVRPVGGPTVRATTSGT